MTLYETLALAPAFVDPGDTEVLRARILAASPRPLRELFKGIPADLALVCRTAMHPELERRYASAGELARDLENVLALRPIAARAPSAAARLADWARRNPARATAAALATALVVGGPLVFGLQQRAANERVAAVNVRLVAANAAADRNLRQAVDAVDTMLARVGHETLRDVPQMVSIRRDLLEDALRFYAGFLAGSDGDPELRRRVELARSRVSALHVTLGDLAEAERELGLLLDTLRAAAARPDADDETLRVYADVAGRLGEVLARRDDHAGAGARIREAIVAHERVPDERRTAYAELQRGQCFDKLGDLEERRGRVAEAEDAVRSAVAISRSGVARFPDDSAFVLALGRQLDRLGTRLLHGGHPDRAVEALRESVARLESYREREPGDAQGATSWPRR